jgi:hypothetical protein
MSNLDKPQPTIALVDAVAIHRESLELAKKEILAVVPVFDNSLQVTATVHRRFDWGDAIITLKVTVNGEEHTEDITVHDRGTRKFDPADRVAEIAGSAREQIVEFIKKKIIGQTSQEFSNAIRDFL